MTKVILIIAAIFLFSSCAKNIDKGTPIRVSGFVVDTVKNKRLSNAKIYLVGGHVRGSNGVTYFYTYVDSTLSDGNGNFSFNYKADGKSVDYVLEVASDNNHSPAQYEQYHFAYNSTDVRLIAQELNFLKLNLKVDYNRYDTFYVYSNYAYQTQLLGRSIDATVYLKVLPNNENVVTYQILYRGSDTSILFRTLRDTMNVGLTDTTTITKRIFSTYQMPLTNG